ncbi:DHA2 family efflux MFS transporter permease subunit [Nocardia sp. 2]|uniref:DHA2 family efflux MFS transporter permease subunit n=1 Tax=Nocardia acididurans TaxID=2802282 RepID=A0ABS1M5J6_9NOCA|nr:DHA2 family efflux MFS transporter permease subunit [Nocardia acididurans]
MWAGSIGRILVTTSTVSRATQRWVLVLGAVASMMAALDTLVVATALGTIREDLDASLATLEWTVNGYNLSFAVLLITAAVLGDRFGRRRMFAVGLGVFVAGSAACAASGSVGVLIAARVVQGVGAALLMSLALTLVSAAFPAERRGWAIGVLEGVTGLAVACGPLIGGAIAEGLSWQWIFWVNVPLGLLAIPLALTRIPESFGSDTAVDGVGLLLVTGGALGVVWGLVRGNIAGWSSPEVLSTLGGGVVLIAVFAVWESRTRTPMFPVRMFTSRGFAAGNTAIFLTYAALFGAVFFYAQFMQLVFHYGPLGAGLRLLPWTLTLFFCAPIAGALADRVGERPIMAVGLLLQAVGMGWLALIADPAMAYGALVPPLVLSGIGVSMAIPTAQSAVVGAVEEGAIGKAAGANSMMRELGGVFGIAVVVAVFAGFGGYASAADFVAGFVPAVAVGAALSLCGAVVALALPGRAAAVPSPADTGEFAKVLE